MGLQASKRSHSDSGGGNHTMEADSDVRASKKLKLETEKTEGDVSSVNGNTEGHVDGTFVNLNRFEVVKILSNSADFKRVVVQARVDGEKEAVIVLDKKPFSEETFQNLFSERSKLSLTFQNDIYGSYNCNPATEAAEIKATVVYPATEKHIEKYSFKPLYLVEETGKIYEEVTSPYLEKAAFDIQWVFNILEKKKETERIVFEDPNPETGFILLPDLKWDGVTPENLYLVAIVHKLGIKSIRELRNEHLPLLENILAAGSKSIEEKYGLKQSQLRIYLHYQPSYYHLHIHFTALGYNAPGIFTEKSHLLQTVISNLKLNPNYYVEATLPFVVKEGDGLYEKLKENGYKF